MALRVVRLGSPRDVRIGTVRRPPRGVAKADHARRDYYDVWLPNLAPSAELVKLGLSARTDADWQAFVRAYRREMAAPEAVNLIATLAALSHSAAFSVGCYCEDEGRCHRGVLGRLLADAGAVVE